MTTPEMEITLARFFEPRRNLIVPNISWGMFEHECDLLVVTQAGYAYEIEIKVSKADLIRDGAKRHNHRSNKICKLYFAVPDKLQSCAEQYAPERAGIITVSSAWKDVGNIQMGRCVVVREAKRNNGYKFTAEDRFNVARLATLRIWGLKETIERLKKIRRKHETS